MGRKYQLDCVEAARALIDPGRSERDSMDLRKTRRTVLCFVVIGEGPVQLETSGSPKGAPVVPEGPSRPCSQSPWL